MRKFLLLIALIISGVGFVNAQNVAKVGEVSYETLPAAIEAANDGETIYLIGNASGAGSVIDKSITIDLDGYTYSFTEGVGSGNLISNGFQILQGNTVVLTNGTLNVAEDYKSNFYILVQNYANLTLNDINLDGTNLDKYSFTDQDSYVLSNNSGEVNIVGNTNITANDEGDKAYAFDVCKFASYDAPTVNVNTTGTINCNIEVSEGYDNNLSIHSGTFTMDVTQWCVEGFVCEQNEDGSYGVSEIQNGDNIIIDYEGYSLKYTVTDVDAKSCSVTCSMKPTQPTDIAIPSSVEIGKIEFSVTSIDPQAFMECLNLTGIEIPNSVTSIGYSAFNGCSSLTSITIPNSVTSIGYPVLSNCPSLTSINVEDGNSVYNSNGNCNAIIETATNTLISGCQSTSIPSTVVSIGSSAFKGCTFITSMYIPSSVTSIGSYAFSGCTSLTSIKIPSGITSIGSYTFKGCSSLASIEIPSTVASIGDYCFEGCSNLMRLYCYAENDPETASTAFKDCPSDMTIYVPTVANYNTSPWSNYDKVTLPSINTTTTIDYNDGDYSLTFKVIEGYQCEVSRSKKPTVPTSITIPASVEINGVEFNVTRIGSFSLCSNLVSIEIPNTVTVIDGYAFFYCESLISVRCLAEIAPSIDGNTNNVFMNVPSGMHIQIPENSKNYVQPWKKYTITKIYPYHYGEYVVKEYEGYSLRFTADPVYEGATVKCEVKPTTPTAITIPSTVEINEMEFNVTAIKASAFKSCSNLTSIEIPNTVTSIGEDAFDFCSSLTSIDFVDNSQLTSIDSYAFSGCSSLTIIDFGDNSQLTSIGGSAFYQCSNLTSIDFGDNSQLTSIGGSAFYKCSNLTSIEIPSGVTDIGSLAFSSCSNLKSIRCLAEEVPSMGKDAITPNVAYGMQIQVPENSIELYKSTEPWSKYTITKIYPYHYGEYAVKEYDGYSLKFTANPMYEGATVKCEVKPTTSTAITIPSTVEINEMEFNVTAIEATAFYQCSNLTSIEIPSSVKELIGGTHAYNSNSYGCFESCSNLTNVAFEDNSQLISIGDYVFSACSSLTSIDFGDNSQLNSIGNFAFEKCSKLTSIEIPNSVTSIGGSAFYQCSKLTSIEIPNSVTSIGGGAFSGCSNLERLMFAKDSKLNTIGNSAFSNCSSLTSVTIPKTVTSIGNTAFYYCSNILKFSFEENSQLNSIGNSAFYYCSKLTGMEVPNTVTSIGSHTFNHCSNLTSVAFEDNSQLNSIGASAFSYCSGLTSIDFGDNSQLASIGDEAFSYCYSLEGIDFGENSKLASIGSAAFEEAFSSSAVIEIPSGVTSIDNSAFESAKMSGISFGENSQLTSISNSAFKDCSDLTNIVIPKNVTEIRNFAFQGCSELQTVTFEEGSQMRSISDLAFKACTVLQMVEIPSGVNYVGFESFANCKNLIMIKNYAVEVPVTDSDAFKSCPERMRIQVPAESLEAYQAETPWNKYTLVTEIVQHEIAASPSINNAGTIQGTGTYFLNENVTLTAKASSSKYKFAYWSEDAEFVSDKAEYTFVVESDRNLVANFMNDNYWKPNAGISAHNMTVTADVQIEGVSANDINIEIGAFCGNELRGNARIQYFEAVDKFLYQIVIYGVNDDEITFKLYDHNTKQVLDYLTQANLTFIEDATHGSIDEPMAINFTQKPMFEITATCNIEDACSVTGGGLYSEGEQATVTANQVEGLLFQNWTLNGEVVSTNRSYTFVVTEAQEYVANYVYAHNRHLNKGWNWYSTYMQLSGEDGLNTVQTALGNAVGLMKSQTAFDTYDQGEWIGDLEDYSTEKMYMMNVVNNNGYDLTIIGTPVNPSDYTIELAPNWNWIGYPISTDMSINDALSGITPKHGDYVKSQEHFSQYYEGSGWLGELQTLEKGKGYMYQNTSTEIIELAYPNEVSRTEVKANYSNENNHWIAEIGKYPTNMNIIAVVKDANADFEIGAFCDGECRGSARPIYIEQLDTYMIFLTVYGEEGETITFRYYDVVSEEVYSVTNEVGYAVDATLGTIDEPYVLSFATTSINENGIDMINIYPNPVNVNSEIYLETECDNVEVYNALGVKVAEYENVSSIDGIETSGIYMIKIIEQGNVKFSRLVVK